MSTTSAVNASASSALSLLRGSNASAAAAGAASSATQTDTSTTSDANAAVKLDLSDRAKALLERNQAAQAVADQLTELVQGGRDRNRSNKSGNQTESLATLLGLVSGGQSAPSKAAGTNQGDNQSTTAAKSDNYRQWAASLKGTVTVNDGPAPYGDPTISDQELLKKGVADGLLAGADSYDRVGLPPEVGQAVRTAVASGKVKIQQASEVAGLNAHSTHTWTPNAFGSTDDVGTTSINPTGSVKQAIEEGRAAAMWTTDRGDIYVTW